MQQWEYCKYTDRDNKGIPCAYGEEGWELVSVYPMIKNGDTIGAIFYFKRPKEK